MVIFYFIGALLLFIPAITTCLNKFSTFYYVKYMIFFYSFGKLVLQTLMLIFIQIDYVGSWNENVCQYLKPLTLFWLIWDYITICISLIYLVLYLIIFICHCEYYDDESFED